MKEEIIRRAQKNITYERVCGYFVRVERCQSGGHGGWAVIGDAVAVLLFLVSWFCGYLVRAYGYLVRVCGYFVRVERCQSAGHGTWAVIGEAVAVVLFLTSAWLIWAWLP
jgi:hypothetical protein